MTLQNIINHFKSFLVKRVLKPNIMAKLSVEDKLIITEIGLPNKILDFQFTNDLQFKSKSELIIGKTYNKQDILLIIESGNIVKDEDNCFLAKSLKNLILQLYTYDYLWKVIIPEAKFGNYRENYNHKKYAQFLENELLKIDPYLLENDNKYFWGSMIEDIEFGIVG
ncbi:hypothetical protein FNW52_15850 [Flavobacterium sp. ZT3R18]|uniref:hypothetical protein n=1 Tax=Flavobacterium sp. ZT3R18 TaxID=2594429 RepID=UPI00117B3513|nr:hypothetical protein [Flavobacterium sp. ZT3R18]TRX33231.1 hypothetical protein FNW52_15850 [Flavobacterium sp. ZT3R18]